MLIMHEETCPSAVDVSYCPRKSEHQPRLIGYPVRVQPRHLIEQFLVGLRGFLQPIEILEVTLGVLNRRGRVGRARFFVTRQQQSPGSARLAGRAPQKICCGCRRDAFRKNVLITLIIPQEVDR